MTTARRTPPTARTRVGVALPDGATVEAIGKLPPGPLLVRVPTSWRPDHIEQLLAHLGARLDRQLIAIPAEFGIVERSAVAPGGGPESAEVPTGPRCTQGDTTADAQHRWQVDAAAGGFTCRGCGWTLTGPGAPGLLNDRGWTVEPGAALSPAMEVWNALEWLAEHEGALSYRAGHGWTARVGRKDATAGGLVKAVALCGQLIAGAPNG